MSHLLVTCLSPIFTKHQNEHTNQRAHEFVSELNCEIFNGIEKCLEKLNFYFCQVITLNCEVFH